MKLKIIMLASMLMLPFGLLYAQDESNENGVNNPANPPNPPGHEFDEDDNALHGRGHERHQGVGNGHKKFDRSPS